MVRVNVYGDVKATCTQRVLILLEELNLKYEVKSVDLGKGEQRGEEFMKLQPFGKVPAVEYDELTKFPELKAIIVDLLTHDFDPFVASIDWVAPKPTTFRINLRNGDSIAAVAKVMADDDVDENDIDATIESTENNDELTDGTTLDNIEE